MADPTDYPQTYTDSNGHIWKSEEPLDGDVCQVCGVEFRYRARWTHDAGGKAVAIPAVPASPLDVARGTAAPSASPIEVWMRAQFEQDLKDMMAKMDEYGTSDLEVMGTAMARMLPRGGNADPATAGAELALSHYALGKASRLFSAWEKGNMPGGDTWKDLQTYSAMARYVRSQGGKLA
jgi:hypothetical protein